MKEGVSSVRTFLNKIDSMEDEMENLSGSVRYGDEDEDFDPERENGDQVYDVQGLCVLSY